MRSTRCTGSTVGHGRNVLKSEWIVEAASPGVAGQCAARATQEAPSGRGEMFLKATGMLKQRSRELPVNAHHIRLLHRSIIAQGRNVLKSEWNVEAAPPWELPVNGQHVLHRKHNKAWAKRF